MKSLKIENGDMIFDSLGKVELVSGKNLLIQSLTLRLKTLKGELFYNDTYGHPILKGKQNENTVLLYLKDTLMDDKRIFDIEIIKFETLILGQFKVDSILTLNTGENLDFNFLF